MIVLECMIYFSNVASFYLGIGIELNKLIKLACYIYYYIKRHEWPVKKDNMGGSLIKKIKTSTSG